MTGLQPGVLEEHQGLKPAAKRAAWMNNFIPVQDSWVLIGKLAGSVGEKSQVRTL